VLCLIVICCVIKYRNTAGQFFGRLFALLKKYSKSKVAADPGSSFKMIFTLFVVLDRFDEVGENAVGQLASIL
jgi:hypothetical protein